MVQQLSTNTFGCAKWIVSSDATQGTHTTIAAAIASASAGDTIFLRPGTYTEDLTLKNGVQLAGLDYVGGSGERTKIIGKLIDNGGVVNATLTNISLQTNGDYVLELTGTGVIVLSGVLVKCTNNTGISTAAGASSYLYNCTGDLGTTGIGYWTGGGSLRISDGSFSNSGSSLAASTTSGTVNILNSSFTSAVATSGSGIYSIRNTSINCTLINTTALTTAGTGTSVCNNCVFSSGSASAISVGAGSTCEIYNSTVSSSNTNAITGAGTAKVDAVTYTSTGETNNATTRTFSEFGERGIFTPAITFGGASVGITYSSQAGFYLRIGNEVIFTLSVILSSKGSSAGTALVTGLPYNPSITHIWAISANALTFTGMVNARHPGGATGISIDQWASGGARSSLTNAEFADTTFIQISGSYLV